MDPIKMNIPDDFPTAASEKAMSHAEEKNRHILLKLAESEQRFRALVTATADVIYRMSPDWREMREMQGSSWLQGTDDAITGWLEKYIPPEDHPLLLENIQQATASGNIFELEHRIYLANGETGWAFSRAVPISGADGHITEWFGALSDITTRKATEAALRTEKELADSRKRLYETVTNNTPDLFYVFDLQYRFIYANEALLAMWGMTWEEASGKLLLEIGYEPWHADMHEREIDQVVATKQSIRGEVAFPHATFGKRIYDYIFVPVVNQLGEVEAIAGTTRDITEIRLAEEALQRNREQLEALVEERTQALHRSNEDLQQFAHVASHDLKEPVRKIALFANLLQDECSSQLNPQGLGYLQTLHRSAIRMYGMIEDILSYSSFQMADLKMQYVDLNDVFHHIENDLEVLIRQKQATLHYAALPTIPASELLLFQLFFNLISNAIKFSRAGVPPVINITAHTQPAGEIVPAGLDATLTHLRIDLRDNGIGFSQQYAEKIFQTFARLNTKDQFEGTGLGLALCRKIVERHGGAISATGMEGEGAVFTILLPLKQV